MSRLVISIALIIFGAGLLVLTLRSPSQETITTLPKPEQTTNPVFPPITASPSPTPFTHYTPPKIAKKDAYSLFMVGDSMTVALGPHPFQLSQRLNAAYPNTGFITDNYSRGSVSIYSLPDLLTTPHQFEAKEEPAILNRPIDIMIIESFGNNPLSQEPLEVGLQKQREVLDVTLQRIIREQPNAYILFLATVAPTNQYAKNVLDLPPDLRVGYANERRQYIEAFIRYAKEKGIPLVDVYNQTRLSTGDGDLQWLNRDDNIHPSQAGIELIQNEIADYIEENGVLPKE